MSKLEKILIGINIVNIIICCHVALTVLDHNVVSFWYFYLICLGLILNGVGTIIATNRTTK